MKRTTSSNRESCSFAHIWTRISKRGNWYKEKKKRKYGNSWSIWMCAWHWSEMHVNKMVESLDFNSVFLQGDKLEGEIFLRPPSDICPESQVWKLKRCIYGFNDVPHSWYKRDNHELTNLKGIVSAYNNALFLWHDTTGNLMGILAMHEDDFVFCGNDLFQKNVISDLKKIFNVGIHESETFKFLVLHVRQTKDGITIDQNLYVSSIFPIDIKKKDELSQEEN